MKIQTKAILLSAFIFPGVGHFVLKNKTRGAVYVIFSALTLCYLVLDIVKSAQLIAQQIKAGAINADIQSITLAVNQQMNDSTNINLLFYTFLFTWAISLVDTVYLSRNSPEKSAS